MARKIYASKPPAPDGPPQWGEREVRRLLRSLRRPHTLAMEPLARFLCEAYALDSPYDAALRFIGETFVDRGLVGKKLFGLIRACDIEANETLLAAASEMGVSPRQFFRYRREAIVALVAHANRLGLAHPAPAGPVEELARLLKETDPEAASRLYEMAATTQERISLDRVDALLNAGEFFGDTVLQEFEGIDRLRVLVRIARACYIFGDARSGDSLLDEVRAVIADTVVEDRELLEFELLHVQYVRAIHREPVTRCAAIGREARRAAQGDELRTIAAILIEIESALRAGDLAFAEQTLTAAEALIMRRKHVRLVTIAICSRAATAFMRGDLARAYGYIHSARLALPDRPLDAMTINAFIGRVSLAMGLPWRAPRGLLEVTQPPLRTLAQWPKRAPLALNGSTRLMFPRLYLKLVDLRAAAVAGELRGDDEIHETCALAAEAGYPMLEAMALAQLGETMRAWEIVTRVGDFFLGYDLFAPFSGARYDFGAADLNETFLDAWQRSLAERFPHAAFARNEGDGVSGDFWRTALRSARRGESELTRLPDHPFVARIAGSAGADAAQKQRTPFVRSVASDAAILLPASERVAFIDTLTRALESCYERLPGTVAKARRPQF